MEPCWLFLVTVNLDRAVCSLRFVYVNRRMGRVGHLNLAIESVPRLFDVITSLLDGDDRVFCVMGVVGFARSAGRDWRC